MIEKIVQWITKFLLWLRYRIEFRGVQKIRKKGKEKILFLPNHPAYMDPVIVFTYLRGWFKTHGLADQDQLERPVVGYFGKKWGVRGIPPINKYGSVGREEIHRQMQDCIDELNRGKSFVLWPSGSLMKSKTESLGANSAVEQIIKNVPDLRVVLVRTQGLWGSSLSWGPGCEPKVGKALIAGVLRLFANGLFFMPRRKVVVELKEAHDLPVNEGRDCINRYIENYYNEEPWPNRRVAYYFWEKPRVQDLPDPDLGRVQIDASEVPQGTREIVYDFLRDLSGVEKIDPQQRLGEDLGLDSLARGEIVMWLEEEFGQEQADTDVLETVSDVLLAAHGQFALGGEKEIAPPDKIWQKTMQNPGKKLRLKPAEGHTIAHVFLNLCKGRWDKTLMSDQTSGTLTSRKFARACIVMSREIERLDGDHIGILLPASAGAGILFLSTLFVRKIPVMINWTTGQRNIVHSLETVGVKKIITSRRLIERVKRQGIKLDEIADSFVYIEDIRKGLSLRTKTMALLASLLCPARTLGRKLSPNLEMQDETAVVLFTSGSETKPKSVPLTHKNLLTNLHDVLQLVEVSTHDSLIAFLPPFHSFGLTGNILICLCAGARSLYYPNPMEGPVLGELIDKYSISVLMGTPRFLSGIIQTCSKEQLASLQIAVTGAEACPEKVYKQLEDKCPQTTVLEGYGVTECSPIITVNPSGNPKPFTIGRLMPSLDYRLLDQQTSEPLGTEGTGILIVSGPSVFGGYIGRDNSDTFLEIEGKPYYNTGDIVEVDREGIFTFKGRMKRFVKLGGEMISLPAIEHVLDKAFANDPDQPPAIAVLETDSQNPELVLFTPLDLDRETVNAAIKNAGLSGLHNIRRVIHIHEMPVLGTGKTDYRTLKDKLKNE